jgi:hypothetical protein
VYTLITAASSAEAHKLKNKLNLTDVILGDYLELPAFMLASGNIIKLPNPDSIAYAHEMLTLCLDKNINAVYPLRDKEKGILKEAEQLLEEYGIKVISNSDHEL